MTFIPGISAVVGDYRIPILIIDKESDVVGQLDQGWSIEDFYSLCTMFRLNPIRLLDHIEEEAFDNIRNGYINPSRDYYVRIDISEYRPSNLDMKS